MTDRELMQQALDVLEDIFGKNKIDVGVINRLRERLSQPEQEPRQWQGLTDEEIEYMMDYWSDDARSAYGGAHAANGEYVDIPDIIRDAEARLRERNT